MSINAGNAACTTGLSKLLYDQWTADANSGFSGSLSTAQQNMIKAQCWAVANNVAAQHNADGPAFYHVFYNQPGPLPLTSGTFTTRGRSPLLVIASGSGFHNTGSANIGFNFAIDGTTYGGPTQFANEGLSHKAFPTFFYIISGLPAGAHTMQLTVGLANTQTDANDKFHVLLIEL